MLSGVWLLLEVWIDLIIELLLVLLHGKSAGVAGVAVAAGVPGSAAAPGRACASVPAPAGFISKAEGVNEVSRDEKRDVVLVTLGGGHR
jgi:hypothetical protein